MIVVGNKSNIMRFYEFMSAVSDPHAIQIGEILILIKFIAKDEKIKSN